MTREEALEILKTIEDIYPRFQLTTQKALVLIPSLMKMDYEGVKENLSTFVMENPYPPTLSEIAAYPAEENTQLMQIEAWQEEAKQVAPEVKERFRKQLEQLIKEKRGISDEHV